MSDRRKIFMVEDSETQALALTFILDKQGIDAVVAGDSEAAMLCLSQSRFDAAIIDYHLPGMEGDELCRRIRQNVSTRSLPLIMLTSEDSAEVISIDSGADVYISKPIDVDILLMRLGALFNKAARAGQELD